MKQLRNSMTSAHANHGFTLIEVVMSMAIMAILMAAMTSVIMVASHALPDRDTLLDPRAVASDAVDQIAAELFYATAITEETATTVTFTVADRGHGAAGPETIRYAWSGTPGDPLTRQYNGGTVIAVCETAQDFSLTYHFKISALSGPPSVLLIVANDVTPNAQDLARQQQISSWGFAVVMLSPSRSDAEYAAALDAVDVVYLSEELTSPLPAWAFNTGRGIVCEKQQYLDEVGIARISNWQWYSVLQIVDNTHYITSPFPLGPLTIFSSDQYGITSTNSITPDGTILGNNSGYDIMVAVDLEGALHGGSTARARRVSMPWGDRDFDFTSVTEDGLTLMQRAIDWAAAPVVYSRVRVTLQPSTDPEPIRTEIGLFNSPEVAL
jgi:prepilin-type N-terminal cleavage/methylation domain-containing protein